MPAAGHNTRREAKHPGEPVGQGRGHNRIVVGSNNDQAIDVIPKSTQLAAVANVRIETRKRREPVDKTRDQHERAQPPVPRKRTERAQHGQAAEAVRNNDGVFVRRAERLSHRIFPLPGVWLEWVRQARDQARDPARPKLLGQSLKPVILGGRTVSVEDNGAL